MVEAVDVSAWFCCHRIVIGTGIKSQVLKALNKKLRSLESMVFWVLF